MKPYVTELLDLLNKPALLNWANKIGLQGISIDQYRDNLKKTGTNLHYQVERFLKVGQPMDEPKDQKALERFLENKKVLAVEYKLETDYFTGKCDVVFSTETGARVVADFKSNHKGIYFENILQLVAYSMSVECDKLAIVSIPDFRIIPVIVNDIAPYQQILIHLSAIYNLKKQIG